ncbi:lipid-binding protein, partial [Coniosporium uncinatum]
QEDAFAAGLEEYRSVLKEIRNTESSVQPSRDHKAKVSDEIAKLKYKEPTSTKISQLEQELVRAEAQSLVAEAQLTNITRQKLKEAYSIHLGAVIERSEKQALLAKQARRVLALLDDTPVVPGDTPPAYEGAESARQILNEAEDELRSWKPTWEDDDLSSNMNQMRLTDGGVPEAHEDHAAEVERREYEQAQHIGAGTSNVNTAHTSNVSTAYTSNVSRADPETISLDTYNATTA